MVCVCVCNSFHSLLQKHKISVYRKTKLEIVTMKHPRFTGINIAPLMWKLGKPHAIKKEKYWEYRR